MSNTLCSFPFVHTDIEPNGDIKFCCSAWNNMHRDSNGNLYNITTHTLKEAWNSDLLKQTRLDLINGKRPEVCRYCWEMENADNTAGNSTRLQAANRRVSIESIQDRIEYARTHNGELDQLAFDFQLSIGNLCNLACKMCNSGYSTQYQKLYSKFFEKSENISFIKGVTVLPDEHMDKRIPFGTTFDWPLHIPLSEIFKDHVMDLQRIFFTGGEPTLIPQVIEFIEYLSSVPHRDDLTMWPSTNCTNINRRLLNALEKFNNVWLNLSLDGMGDIAYIQRTPSNWESIERNVDMLIDWIKEQSANPNKHFQLTLISTVTALNLHHITDFWEYFSQRYSDRVHFGVSVNLVMHRGTNFGVEIVPKSVAEELKEKIKRYNGAYPKHTEYAFEYYKNLLETTNFAKDYELMHYCLDEVQRIHLDKNIREIYSIYYK